MTLHSIYDNKKSKRKDIIKAMGIFSKKKETITFEDAQSLLARKQYAKATDVLRKLIRRNPRDDKLKLRLADALAMSGKKQEALLLYDELANYYAKSGYTHKAIAVNKMILKINPHMTDIQQKLENLYHHQEVSFKQKITQLEEDDSVKDIPEAAQKVPEEKQQPVIQKSAEEKSQEAAKQASSEEPKEIFQETSSLKPQKQTGEIPPEEPKGVFQNASLETQLHDPHEISIEPTQAMPEEVEKESEDITPKKVPLFSDLTKEEFAEVAKMMNLKEFSSGEVIIREGEPGSSLFIITDGEVEVISKDKKGQDVSLAILKDGDFFGEVSLLTGRPRTATIIAKSYVRMIELDKESLNAISISFPRVQEVLKEFYQQRVHQTIEAMLKSFKES